MQPQNNQAEHNKTGKGWIKRITVWGTLGCCLILSTLVGVLLFYIKMPVHVNRDLSDKLPWCSGGIVIDKLKVSWKDASHHPTLSKRTRLYPEATLRLASAPGKGRIDVVFLNPDGTQVGDTHNLRYSDGQFEKRKDRISVAEGNEATVWLETGYSSSDLFAVQSLDRKENLWRVVLIHRAENTNEAVRLGQVSIKAEITPAEGKQ